jgi:hypothetical protein
MSRKNYTTPARETYVHPADPAGYLKSGDTLMAGGYDFAWCYVWFKDVIGKPGYCVGHDGSVWSCWICGSKARVTDSWHRLKPWSDRNGYQRVDLGSRHSDCRFVYHLVLEAFVGPCPPGLECRHLDGNPANNRVENLHWGTHAENMADMVRHGRAAKGQEHPYAILTEADVLEALSLRAAGESIGSIARRLGVDRCTISSIFHGRNWRHVTDVAGLPPARENWGIPKGEKQHLAVLKETDVLDVLEKHRAGESTRSIARRLGVARKTIQSILGGRTWRHVTGMTPSGPGCSTS